ncbi:MAG: NigD-like C-terminal domain-containing protein [Dysgonamonadaceae bacterium]
MGRKNILLYSFIFLLPFFGCDKESTRTDDFLVEFAIVKKVGDDVTFRLDNGTILTPEGTTNLEIEDGNRVILNYTPLEKGVIKVNSVRRIFMGSIKKEGYPNDVKTDPVRIISVWVSGIFLNISFEVDYHSKSHRAGLYRDMSADEQTLYFSYSREDDPLGAPTLSYMSFNLESLQKKNFTVFINTYEGQRKFEFEKEGER